MLIRRFVKKIHLDVYFDRRIISIFLFGILSGLPWVMIGSALTLWLKEAGVTRTEIGYAGLIFAVFAINFLWSPLLDQLRPRLFSRLGSRRSWIVLCQLVIAAACYTMSFSNPETNAKFLVMVGLILAFASATQDMAIDAYRVDQFAPTDSRLISAGAAAATAGWWTGYAGLGYFPLVLSDVGWTWPQLYVALGCITLAVCSLILFSPDPPERSREAQQATYRGNLNLLAQLGTHLKLGFTALCLSPVLLAIWSIIGSPGVPQRITQYALYIPAIVALELLLVLRILFALRGLKRRVPTQAPPPQKHPLNTLPAWLLTTIIAPLEDFFQRNGVRLALSLLAFILLFKLGEAFLGRMSIVFYKEVGFSNTDIATYSKMLTWWVTIIAAIPCGLLNAHFGLIKGLWISGICMAASNLMFAVIAVIGPDINWYIASVVIDGVTAAWATVAFVSFISMLCSHTFSATQYALLASLGALGRTTLASFSGQMVDALEGDWAVFFIVTALMVIPGLVLLWSMSGRIREVYQGVESNKERENRLKPGSDP